MKINLENLAIVNKRIEQEYNDLIRQFGTDDGNGNISINPTLENGENNPNFLEFAEKANELMLIEEDIAINIISIDSFPADSDLEIADLIQLEFMIGN
jgi:hypothetical protein